MLSQIVAHTPTWVWITLLVLLWLGLAQAAPRRVTLRRVIALPLAMTVFAMYGTFSAFGAGSWSWVLWLGAGLVTATWFASSELPHGVRYEPVARVFHLPGSWEPLALMMMIFWTRYSVAVVLATHPELTQDMATAAIVSSVYGAMSGVFFGRMLRLLRVTRADTPPPDGQTVAWG